MFLFIQFFLVLVTSHKAYYNSTPVLELTQFSGQVHYFSNKGKYYLITK